jgi:hypothetical protein
MILIHLRIPKTLLADSFWELSATDLPASTGAPSFSGLSQLNHISFEDLVDTGIIAREHLYQICYISIIDLVTRPT